MNIYEENNIKQKSFSSNGYFSTFYKWRGITAGQFIIKILDGKIC